MYGYCKNPYNVNDTCYQPRTYCNYCEPVYNPMIEYISNLYGNLENNYPMNRCKYHDFGISPKYYIAPNILCDYRGKCY